jgi:hypothetical protein
MQGHFAIEASGLFDIGGFNAFGVSWHIDRSVSFCYERLRKE